MGKSFDEVRALKKDLKSNVFCNPPYDRLVNGVGVSTLGLKSSLDSRLEDINLKPGESWDDHCISVYLEERPPAELSLPREYKGVRVCYDIIGKIRAC